MHAVNKWLAQGAQLIALMIFGAYLFFWLREKPVHWRTSMYHAGLWARRHTPPDAVFGMTHVYHGIPLALFAESSLLLQARR